MGSESKDQEENSAIKEWRKEMDVRHAKGQVLLDNIKANLPELEELYEKAQFAKEDKIYRFYHHSFKVYWLQEYTQDFIKLFLKVSPHDTDKIDKTFDNLFLEIIAEGASGKEWERNHNDEWSKNTRPFVEAFFHVMYFLEMMIKFGKELEEAPNMLPSGWAALLEIYKIR